MTGSDTILSGGLPPADGAAPARAAGTPEPAALGYRVDLDIYQGPLDLLLYLIRKSEVDIYDIPIARITEQYLSYMAAIQLLEPAVAGDFLVLAATLMEIKSRMLLPKPPPGEEEEEEDPRSELVRQLLEYKRYKDAAAWLGDQAEARAERFGRLAPEPLQAEAPADQDLRELELWDLVEAFSRLMRATLSNLPNTITAEDVPVSELTEYILRRLERESIVPFVGLFEDQPTRRHVAGMFLALLELVRLRRVQAVQREAFGEIFLRLRAPEVLPAEPENQPPAASLQPPTADPEPSQARPPEPSQARSPGDREPAAGPPTHTEE